MEIKPAVGVCGTIFTTIDGLLIFRVYDENHEFIDYEIHHSDLSVKIIDQDSALYTDKIGNCWLDHHPATLGKDNET